MDRIQRFAAECFRGIGSPLAARALALVEAGEWAELTRLRPAPLYAYTCPQSYRDDLFVTELFRKCQFPANAGKQREAAVATFWASETQCAATNARLARYNPNSQLLEDGLDVRVADFIGLWRKKVRRVLGKASYVLDPMFSQGATLSDHGKRTTIPDKMSSAPTAYARSVPLYKEAFARTPQGEQYPDPIIVTSNRFFTVPKDVEKDRGCCVEASACVSLQLAVAERIWRRIEKHYKVRLRHAKLRHMRLARLASAGRLSCATIDLSNASDTVAYQLVKLVLPPDWFELLISLRAPFTDVDGKRVRLEKFSSMGNGFTFALETLLFWTLCDTVSNGEAQVLRVFGDDILVDSTHAKACVRALEFFGFTPNAKKTFLEGPFRESCGGDYFNGVSVRAVYVKKLPDEPQQWMKVANQLYRWSRGFQADTRLKRAHAYALNQLPAALRRCRGPESLGDIVITTTNPVPTVRAYSTRTGGKSYANSPAPFYRVYRPVQAKFRVDKHFTYRVATAAGALGVGEEVAPRDSVSGYKLDWVCAWGVADVEIGANRLAS